MDAAAEIPEPATLGSERHRYAIIAWPDKLGTDPMAVGGCSMNGRRRGNREESRE